MALRWVVYKGIHGLPTDPVLQEQDALGDWVNIQIVEIGREEVKESPPEGKHKD